MDKDNIKAFVAENRIVCCLYLIWTLWFLLDRTLGYRYFTAYQLVVPLAGWCWVLGMIILTEFRAIFHRYGVAGVLTSLVGIFVLLWICSQKLPVILWSDPYDLYLLWTEGGVERYGGFVSWLQAWSVCLGGVLFGGWIWRRRK